MTNIKIKKNALDYIVLTLAKWQIDDEKLSIDEFNLNNNFSYEKLLILPFLIVTANGLANRKLLLDNTFDKFKINDKFTYYEIDLKNHLDCENNSKSTFVDYSNNEKISLLIDLDAINNIDSLFSDSSNEWKNTMIGLNHSIIKVFKQKYKIPLYQFSFEQLKYNILKSTTVDILLEHNFFSDDFIPKEIIESEQSVFAEEEKYRIFA